MILRFCLALMLLLFWASSAQAQIALVSGQSATSTSGTMWVTGSLDETLNFPSAVTTNNTVVAWTIFADSRRTMSCTHDGGAMTALTLTGATSASGDPIVLLFARVATTTGTGVTCTISLGDANTTQAFAIAEFSGAATTLSTQGGAGVTTTTAVETSATTTHDSGADLTPDTGHNLMLGALLCSSAPGTMSDDGYTMLITSAFWKAGYLIQSSATPNDFVPVSDVNTSCEVVAQNLDGASAAAAPRRIRRIGL